MDSPRRRPWFFFALATPASAQTLRLGIWSGSLETRVDFDRTKTSTRGGRTSRFEFTRVEELLRLRNTGISILNPGLVSLDLGGTAGLSQEWTRSTGAGSEFRPGTLTGYDALARILSVKPYSVELFANRNESVLSRELGGRTSTEMERRGARLRARGFLIPSTLSFRQELLDEESRAGDVVSRRDERRYVATYEGRRGWEDGEMELRYEFVDLDDRVFPTLSRRSHEALGRTSIDFGEDLNWRWDSQLRYYTRESISSARGALGDVTTMTANERLRVDHTERLRSQYSYQFLRTETLGQESTSHTGSVDVTHQLYESLRTHGLVDGTLTSQPGAEKKRARGRLDLRYTKRLPAGGRLTIGLGGGLEYEDDRFSRGEVFVAQERHTFATPFALPVALDNPQVVESTVVVTKVAAGPLLAGCLPVPGPPLPLQLGRDYTLRTTGGVTEVVAIPCSGADPGINPGDTIAVDYQFSVDRSLSFTTATGRVDVNVDYGWIRLFAGYARSDQNLLSGQDGRFLEDWQTTTTGLELRKEGARLDASVLAEAMWHDSTRAGLSYNRYRSAQSLGLQLRADLRLNLNADEALTEYPGQGRETRTASGRGTLTYVLGARVFAEAIAAYSQIEDTRVPTERRLEGRLRVTWRIARLEVRPSLAYFRVKRGDTETSDLRAMLHVIRRF